ncbi:MAG TPA: hypothetical protein DCS43_10885 [Verrucomicrobia bacterium]|nr:hypothetical protein [Verrucomicrobiota bacterium]
MAQFFSLWLKLFFVFTPFFALTMFISLTEMDDIPHRRQVALNTTGAVGGVCLLLFFLGPQVFWLFGITLDSFRIGGGILLMLSAISLVHGRPGSSASAGVQDVAVVPLAVPIIVGPATAATLMVLGAELTTVSDRIIGCLSLILAVLCMGAVLLSATPIYRRIGVRGLAMLSKITGLILSALSAQMVMTGIRGFLAGR